jgi:hypothetical protein
MAAREVVVLVSGRGKREPLRRVLAGVATPDVPASVLAGHPELHDPHRPGRLFRMTRRVLRLRDIWAA